MITPYWNSFEANNFEEAYKILAEGVLRGKKVGNTREMVNILFTIRDIEDVYSSRRNPSKEYMLAELIWYFAGSRDTEWISQFAPYWKKISDNGITSNSAYGYIIKHKHSFDQYIKMIELLKKDPTSRRAVININEANPNVIITKDEPCTIALQFYIRHDKLNCTAMMRSNDIWRGLPYDVVYFTALQKKMAEALGVGYGTYTHFDTSLHMYDRDEDKIRAALSEEREIDKFYIDHKKLSENAKKLYQVVNKDNILKVCRENKIIKIGE